MINEMMWQFSIEIITATWSKNEEWRTKNGNANGNGNGMEIGAKQMKEKNKKGWVTWTFRFLNLILIYIK